MYNLYKKSLMYDRRSKEYLSFLEGECKRNGLYSTNIIQINPILTYDRTIYDYYKIKLYLYRLINDSDCVDIIMKYIKNIKEETTLEWYKNLYDIVRCRGIHKLYDIVRGKGIHKLFNDKPALNIPWPYYNGGNSISYMNCTIFNKINNKKIIKYKYGHGHVADRWGKGLLSKGCIDDAWVRFRCGNKSYYWNSINETLTCFLPSSATDIIDNIDMEPSDFDEAYKVSKLQDLNNHRYTSSK